MRAGTARSGTGAGGRKGEERAGITRLACQRSVGIPIFELRVAPSSATGWTEMGMLVLLAILVALVLFVVTMYNRLVSLRNRFRNAFAQIDVQLKRRYDLIPNLVETARAYMKHERETLEAVIAARNSAAQAERQVAGDPTDAAAMQSLISAERGLGGALTRFFALAEAYPDLKADANMRQLSEELTSTENRIAFARQSYNDAVTSYNTARETFPANLIAGTFNFSEAPLLIIEDETERTAPRVSF
jgi:LemA protein